MNQTCQVFKTWQVSFADRTFADFGVKPVTSSGKREKETKRGLSVFGKGPYILWLAAKRADKFLNADAVIMKQIMDAIER